MFKKGELVKLKDRLYSEVDALHFQDKEIYEMYFGFEGVVVGKVENKVYVVFDRQIEELNVDMLEKSYEPKEYYGIMVDEGNGHTRVEVFGTLEEAQNRADTLEYGIITILDEVVFYE